MDPCERAELLLAERFGRALPSADEHELNTHLAGCATCRKVADGNQQLRGVLDAYPLEDVPDAVSARVLAEARRSRRARPGLRRALPWIAAAAAAVLIWFALPTGEGDGESATELLVVVQEFVTSGDYGEALDELDHLDTLQHPLTPDQQQFALELRAEALVGVGETTAAIDALDQLAVRFPDQLEAVRRRIGEITESQVLGDEELEQLRSLGYVGGD